MNKEVTVSVELEGDNYDIRSIKQIADLVELGVNYIRLGKSAVCSQLRKELDDLFKDQKSQIMSFRTEDDAEQIDIFGIRIDIV